MKATKRDYQKLNTFLKRLQKNKQIRGFALVGGLAVSAHSEPRATKDIDFLVSYERDFTPELLGELLDRKSYKFIVARGDSKDPLNGLVRVFDSVGDELFDLIPAHWHWQDDVILGAEMVDVFGNVETPIAKIEDLIVLKLVAGGPQDLLDAESLLRIIINKISLKERTKSLAKRARVDKKLQKLIDKLR